MDLQELIVLIVRSVIEELGRQGLLTSLEQSKADPKSAPTPSVQSTTLTAPSEGVTSLAGTHSPPGVGPPEPSKRLLITEARLQELAQSSSERTLKLPPGTIITPLARDKARELGIEIVISP